MSTAQASPPTGSKACLYIGAPPPSFQSGTDYRHRALGNAFRWQHARFVRVALFVTCLDDTLFPGAGRRHRAGARAARLRGGVPARSRPAAARCTGILVLPREAERLAAPAARGLRRVRRVVTPSASCAAIVREHHRISRVFELSEFLVDQLGVEDVGATFPHRVTLPPDLPLAARAAGGRPPAAAAARGARHRPRRAARRAGVLRLRRHVRDQERRRVDWRCSPTSCAACSRHARARCARRPTARA